MVRQAHGRGWILREHAGRRNTGERVGAKFTQVTRAWADGSRSSATVPIPWEPSSAPALLAAVERLKSLVEVQGLPLARAAELIRLQDSGGSAAQVRESVDWSSVVDRFRDHLIGSGRIQERTWRLRYAGHMKEALDALQGKRAPKSGQELLAVLIKDCSDKCAPGSSGRFHRVGHVAALLDFAVQQCGAPARFGPPTAAARKELIGRKLTPAEPSTPLLDHQALKVFRSIPDPRWRTAFGLLVCFGLRPAEIPACRPEKGALRVAGVKRNQSGASRSRLVRALDPIGAPGMGAELLAILEERGKAALPHDCVAAFWGTRMRDQLMKLDAWKEVIAEAEVTGQGHIVVYSCRHGYSHRGAMTYGLSPRTLAPLMGHSVSTHNQKYGRWVSEDDVASAVQAAIARVQNPAASARLIA